MRQVTVHTVISAPREQVFDFVADLSLRPSYCDHFMHDYRLARANPRGLGAAARFRVDRPLAKEWAELTITACERPRRIVEEGRIGRVGRSRLVAVYELVPEAAGTTRVELTSYSEPATLVDSLKQLGASGWTRRKTKRALSRLRDLFEQPQAHPLDRVGVAGYEPETAPRFGAHVPSPHAATGGAVAADR